MPGLGSLFKWLGKHVSNRLYKIGDRVFSWSKTQVGWKRSISKRFAKLLKRNKLLRDKSARWAAAHPWQAAGKSILKKLTFATLVGGTIFALGRIFKGKGDGQPITPADAAREPAFDVMPGVQQGALNPDQLNNLMRAMSASNKSQRVTQIQQAIETAKADQMAYSKLLAKLPHFGNEGVPDKLQKIYAKGKDSGSKLDAIIELLNRQNDITNAHRITSVKIGNMKRAEDEAKADRATQLYQKLSVLHAQSMSANNDAVEAISKSGKVQTGMVMRQQAQQHKQVMEQSKKSSIFKWLLFGGILFGLTKLLGGVSGVANLLKTGFGAVWDGLGSVKDAIFGTAEASARAVSDANDVKDDSKADTEDRTEKAKESGLKSSEDVIDKKTQENQTSDQVIKGDLAREAVQASGLQRSLDKNINKSVLASKEKALDKFKVKADAANAEKLALEQEHSKLLNRQNKAMMNQGMDSKAYKDATKKLNGVEKKLAEKTKIASDYNKAVSARKSQIKDLKDAVEKPKSKTRFTWKRLGQKASKFLGKTAKVVTAPGRFLAKKLIGGDRYNAITSKGKGLLSGLAKGVRNTLTGASTKITGSKAGSKIIGKSKAISKAISKGLSKLFLKTLIGRAAAKAVSKSIPFLGLGFGIWNAIKRVSRGDLGGALIDLGSAAAAQAGMMGNILAPGISTALGLAVSMGFDAWNAKRDANKAVELANKGDLEGLEALGYKAGDIANIIYNFEDEDGKITSLPSDHPLRKKFESKYKSINDLIDGGMDAVEAVSLAQSLKSGPLRKDYDAHANTIAKLQKDKFSNSDILKIISNADVNSVLQKDADKNFDYLDKVAHSEDAWNNNATEQLGIIARNMPKNSVFKKKFTEKYGDPNAYIKSEHERKDKWYKKPISWLESANDWLGKKVNNAGRWLTGNERKIRNALGTASYARGSSDQAIDVLSGKVPEDAHPGGAAIVGDPVKPGDPDKPEIVVEPGQNPKVSLIDHQQAGVYKKGTTVIPYLKNSDGSKLTKDQAKDLNKSGFKVKIKPGTNTAEVSKYAEGTGDELDGSQEDQHELSNEDIQEQLEDEVKTEKKSSPVQQLSDVNQIERYAIGTIPEDSVTYAGKFDNQDTFVKTMYKAWKSTGVSDPVAVAIVSQEALECGWGKSSAAGFSNYGGVRGKNSVAKSRWKNFNNVADFVNYKLQNSLQKYFPDSLTANSIQDYLYKVQHGKGGAQYCADGEGGESYINSVLSVVPKVQKILGTNFDPGSYNPGPGNGNDSKESGDDSGVSNLPNNDSKGNKGWSRTILDSGKDLEKVVKAALGTGDINPELQLYDEGTGKKLSPEEELRAIITRSNSGTFDSASKGKNTRLNRNEYKGLCTSGPQTFYNEAGINLAGKWWNTGSPKTATGSNLSQAGFDPVWNGTREDSVTVEDLNNALKGKNEKLQPGDVITIFGTKRSGSPSAHAMMWNGSEIVSDTYQGNKIWCYPTGRNGQNSTIVWRYKDFQKPNFNPVTLAASCGTADTGNECTGYEDDAGDDSSAVTSPQSGIGKINWSRTVVNSGKQSAFGQSATKDALGTAALNKAVYSMGTASSVPAFNMATASPVKDDGGSGEPEASPMNSVEISPSYNPTAAIRESAPQPVASPPVNISKGGNNITINYSGGTTYGGSNSTTVIQHGSDDSLTKSAK